VKELERWPHNWGLVRIDKAFRVSVSRFVGNFLSTTGNKARIRRVKTIVSRDRLTRLLNGKQNSPMRILYIEYLRVAAILAVIVIHVTVKPYNKFGEIDQLSWWVSNFLNSASRFAVPLFVMISGAVLLGKSMSTADFYRKRAVRLLPPIFFWTIVYVLFRVYLGMDIDGLISFLKVDLLAEGGAYVHLWYLAMYACLMPFVPFINKFLIGEKPSSSDLVVFVTIVGIFFFLNTVFSVTSELRGITMVWFTSFPWYIGYLVIGYAIEQYGKFIDIRNSIIAASIFLLATIGSWLNYYAADSLGIVNDYFILNNTGILVFSMSLFVFYLGKNSESAFKKNKIIAKISEASFGMYLIHPLFLGFISPIYNGHGIPGYVYVPLAVMAISFLSYFSVSAMRSNKYLRMVC